MGKNKYDWIDDPDKRMKRLSEILNNHDREVYESFRRAMSSEQFINEALSTGEMNDLVKMLYKNVDLNIDDDFAIDMIIISADEFMGKRLDKKEAKKILAQFDKKYPRFRS